MEPRNSGSGAAGGELAHTIGTSSKRPPQRERRAWVSHTLNILRRRGRMFRQLFQAAVEFRHILSRP